MISRSWLMARMAARGKDPKLAIRVHVEECFHHCAKAFIRSELWKPESWGERLKVSFGKIAAGVGRIPDELAGKLDEAVEQDYRENL